MSDQGPLLPFFNEKSLNDWMKTFEQFVEKSFSQYHRIVDELSFAVDTQETEHHYNITAQLNGFDQNDIQLEVYDQSLRIVAQREEITSIQDDNNQYSKRSNKTKRTERVIPLPFGVRKEDLKATFGNGILKITVPKKTAPQYIDIEPEDA